MLARALKQADPADKFDTTDDPLPVFLIRRVGDFVRIKITAAQAFENGISTGYDGHSCEFVRDLIAAQNPVKIEKRGLLRSWKTFLEKR